MSDPEPPVVESTFEPPHPNGAVTTSGITRKRLIRRRLIKLGFVLFVLAWIIAITYSVTAGGKSPERLDDVDAHSVESSCVIAEHALEQLPQLGAHPTTTQQAARVSAEDKVFTTMIAQLRTIHPHQSTPAAALTGWLGDWQRMVTAREHFASDLRTKGTAARFLEPTYSGVDPIPDKMNGWILEQGTRTDTCNTGELQAEVIAGERIYGPESKS